MNDGLKIDFSTPGFVNYFNPKFYKYLFNEDRLLVFVGSAGSGKSHFCARKLVYRFFAESKVKNLFLIVRSTGPAVRKSAFELVKQILEDWNLLGYVTINRSDMLITNTLNESRMLFTGLDDSEKMKSIEGVTGIWVEEATQIAENDFMQLQLRLRPTAAKYAQTMLSYNPVRKDHWTYRRFYRKEKKSYREKIETKIDYAGDSSIIETWQTVLHTTYKDNLFLQPEYVAQLENLAALDHYFYQVYALGEYADLLQSIYRNWTWEDEFPITPKSAEKTIYGLDFAYNSPTALVQIMIKDGIHYCKEVLYETKLITSVLIDRMNMLGISKVFPIYADDEDPAAIEEIRRAGFNIVPACKEPDSVKAGIFYCMGLDLRGLKGDFNLNREVTNYRWKTDKNNNVLEEPFKHDDHLVDALRYAEYTDYKNNNGGSIRCGFIKSDEYGLQLW